MKVTAVVLAAVFAVASVNAAAAPVANAAAEPKYHRWCYRPGQPCWKVKRTAEALAEAEAEPEAAADPKYHRWCYRPGQPCWKAKRGLEDLSAELGASLEDN